MLLVDSLEKEIIDTKIVKKMIDLLLSTDGSTTLALESIMQDTVELHVRNQEIIDRDSIPKEARNFFRENGTYIRRGSSLNYKGVVLSENIVFYDLSLLSKEIIGELEIGEIPLGKLMKKIDTRRNILYKGYQPSGNILEIFEGFSLKSNIFPTKKYQIIHNTNCLFYICEVFHLENIYKFMS